MLIKYRTLSLQVSSCGWFGTGNSSISLLVLHWLITKQPHRCLVETAPTRWPEAISVHEQCSLMCASNAHVFGVCCYAALDASKAVTSWCTVRHAEYFVITYFTSWRGDASTSISIESACSTDAVVQVIVIINFMCMYVWINKSSCCCTVDLCWLFDNLHVFITTFAGTNSACDVSHALWPKTSDIPEIWFVCVDDTTGTTI